ncbi:UNVERIFIED_CONTAM: hypothetical protein K2H54_036319 [Gekko kuhli]
MYGPPRPNPFSPAKTEEVMQESQTHNLLGFQSPVNQPFNNGTENQVGETGAAIPRSAHGGRKSHICKEERSRSTRQTVWSPESPTLSCYSLFLQNACTETPCNVSVVFGGGGGGVRLARELLFGLRKVQIGPESTGFGCRLVTESDTF